MKREFTLANQYLYNQLNPIRWVISHVLRYKLYLLGFGLGMTLSNLLNALIPLLTGRAFDSVVQGQATPGRILSIALSILALVIVRGVGDIAGSFSMEVIGKRVERDARDELYVNLLGKSLTFHNRQQVGDIMARTAEDVRQLNWMLMPGVSLIYDSFMSLVMPLIFVGSLRPELLLFPLLFTIAFLFSLRRYNNQLTPVTDAMRQQFGVMNAGLAETVTGIEVVKVAAQEEQEKGKFYQNARNFRNYFVQEGRIQARYVPPLILGVAIAGAFLHAIYLFNNNVITIGELVSYVGLLWLLRFPAFISIFTFALVQLGLVSAGRILELMHQESEIDENEAGRNQPMQGDLTFENVTFGYGGEPVLKNVSFRARPGQTIAVVGQTGSGKSTLARLVNRTYDVTAGHILIDGIDVRDWHLDSLRSQISTIEQDIFLFSRSIAENIAFGLGQKASQTTIEQAAHEAQAHDFITHFQDGYQTMVGERGVTLSGGQRQRIAIARALLTDPRILILDDATSAIDSATEDKIQTAINRVLQGRTTLLITHRLSQIRRADHILVLRQGELIDQGRHEELLARCDLYRRIFGKRETEQTSPSPNGQKAINGLN